MHKHTQNQSYVGSSGQTLTTKLSMTLCNSQVRHQTHVLCVCTMFGTELKLGPKLIPTRPLFGAKIFHCTGHCAGRTFLGKNPQQGTTAW